MGRILKAIHALTGGGRDSSGPKADRVSGLRDVVRDEKRDDSSAMDELGLGVGVRVDGTYTVVGELGAGGMGVVVLARDERLERDVAIKFIRPQMFAVPEHGAFFVNEARAMARVKHPNVLTVHALGEHCGAPYFVMEYVEGTTVEEWLADAWNGATPDIATALGILEQVCHGVDAIHRSDTVHRDLKPSNLLMDDNGRVAVSDLGVARILRGDGIDPCSIVGSAAYMAPEAALGKDTKGGLATSRDIYALGCIAYELLTGQPPFRAASDMGMMAKHLLEVPAPPSTLRPEVAAYDAVVMRALEKDPHGRFRSADSFLRALFSVKNGDCEPDRILVVDDDQDWRELLVASLRPRFPEAIIDLAKDGEEAEVAFRRAAYAVVLVDIEMPVLDGIELTARLRALASAERTSIIVVTAAGGSEEWKRLSRLGADAFLVKPVESEDIAMLVRRTLRSRRAGM